MEAKKILYENVIGVNQEKLEAHHDFLPSVLKAMEKYAGQHFVYHENDTIGLFESCDGLNKVVDFLILMKLPKEQIFFFTDSGMKRVDMFLKNLGSTGVTSEIIDGTNIRCTRMCYADFNFNLVNINQFDEPVKT